jgi:hypothetical protein
VGGTTDFATWVMVRKGDDEGATLKLLLGWGQPALQNETLRLMPPTSTGPT